MLYASTGFEIAPRRTVTGRQRRVPTMPALPVAWVVALTVAATIGLPSTARAAAGLSESQALALDPELPEAPDDVKADGSAAAPSPGNGSRSYVELGGGRASLRDGGSRSLSRVALDTRLVRQVDTRLQGRLSVRLDRTSPEDPRLEGPVLTLREAALAWQDASRSWTLQGGRINLREGPAYGYNPTDFFKTRALRTITTANPASLRESRLGSVMAHAQRLGADSSWSVALSPKLGDRASRQGLALDLGATNDRARLLLTHGRRWSPEVNSRAVLLAQEGSAVQIGASGSALLGESVVAHLEWAGGRSRSLLGTALGAQEPSRWRDRLAAGATYTTAGGMSWTAEWHHNAAALGRVGWQATAAQSPMALGAYFAEAAFRQDNAGRNGWFLYVTQRDLLRRGLDLTALVKDNRDDRSRFTWFELRQRFERLDLILQWQRGSGAPLTEFGSLPFRQSWGMFVSAYL
jgi:hypothetical protein